MASNNVKGIKLDNFKDGGLDKNETDITSIAVTKSANDEKRCYSYEEAITICGNGCYNITLMILLSMVLISMVFDMFGFSLVVAGCKCEFQLTIAQSGYLTSMSFIGAILMAYPWGYITDTRGRRKTLMMSMSVSCVVSAISSLSPSWQVLAALKLISSSFSSAAQSATYVLLGECCGANIRSVYLLMMTSAIMFANTFYFVVGYITLNLDFSYELGLLNITLSPWRLLTLLLSLPLGVCAICLAFFNESPKFLATQGKTEEAIEAMKNIYKRNGGDEAVYPVRHLIIDEQIVSSKTEQSLLQSIWSQTFPLFKPPLLMRTLRLYFLTAVTYATNNSFVVWFPFFSEAVFSSSGAGGEPVSGVCGFIAHSLAKNVTEASVPACSSRIESETVLSAVLCSVTFTIINIIMSKFASRKKSIIIVIFLASILGGVGLNFAPDPISAMVLFIIFITTALAIGIISSYFIDLYPTSYRGMVTCLGVMVARVSSLVGVNIVGAVIHSYCSTTFYLWSVFVFVGLVVALFLPPDRTPKKTEEDMSNNVKKTMPSDC